MTCQRRRVARTGVPPFILQIDSVILSYVGTCELGGRFLNLGNTCCRDIVRLRILQWCTRACDQSLSILQCLQKTRYAANPRRGDVFQQKMFGVVLRVRRSEACVCVCQNPAPRHVSHIPSMRLQGVMTWWVRRAWRSSARTSEWNQRTWATFGFPKRAISKLQH